MNIFCYAWTGLSFTNTISSLPKLKLQQKKSKSVSEFGQTVVPF